MTPHSSASPGLIDIDGVLDRTDEKGVAVTVHVVTLAAQVLTGGLLHVIVPAVSLLLLQQKSDWLKAHVKEQLNFQLTYLAVAAVGAVLAAITFGLGLVVVLPVIFVLFFADIVCSIQAAMAASRGESFRFPFSVRFIQ